MGLTHEGGTQTVTEEARVLVVARLEHGFKSPRRGRFGTARHVDSGVALVGMVGMVGMVGVVGVVGLDMASRPYMAMGMEEYAGRGSGRKWVLRLTCATMRITGRCIGGMTRACDCSPE